MTAYQVLRPSLRRHAWAYEVACILVASLFVALSAQLAVRLPFSPVPITAQTLAVLLTGAVLGRHRGSLALVAYIGEGVAGLPVFAGGAFGPAYLFGPTGGYLIGMVAAAYVTGLLAERGWDRRVLSTVLAMGAGNVVIYLFGVVCLAKFLGPADALRLGVYPFVVGDLIKIGLGAMLLPAGWRLVRP